MTMKHLMIRGGYIMMAVLISFTFAMAEGTDKSGEKTKQLEKMMGEISAMTHQLSQRETEAAEVRDQLITQLGSIETETRREIQRTGITRPPDVRDHPKIFYNLKLMGELQRYIDRYAQKIEGYRLARSRLGYLYQFADDDLKIIHTLPSLKIDALITQIRNTLASYENDANALLIHPDSFQETSAEAVWVRLHTVKH